MSNLTVVKATYDRYEPEYNPTNGMYEDQEPDVLYILGPKHVMCPCNHKIISGKQQFKQHIKGVGHSTYLQNYAEYGKPETDALKEAQQFRVDYMIEKQKTVRLKKKYETLKEKYKTHQAIYADKISKLKDDNNDLTERNKNMAFELEKHIPSVETTSDFDSDSE